MIERVSHFSSLMRFSGMRFSGTVAMRLPSDEHTAKKAVEEFVQTCILGADGSVSSYTSAGCSGKTNFVAGHTESPDLHDLFVNYAKLQGLDYKESGSPSASGHRLFENA